MARVARNSEDYLRVSATLQSPPSTEDTSVSFTIEAFDDSRIEGEENFIVVLSKPGEGARLGRSTATVIIEGNLSAKRVAISTVSVLD
jgi:hypothetical protein